jgi:hypothetical protein
METFSHTYAVTPEEYLQESLEPPNRLTNRELEQIREIREEIESRQKLTRFEARYIRVLKMAEQEFSGSRMNCDAVIRCVREHLKDVYQTTSSERR